MAAYSKTEDFANMTLTPSVSSAGPGEKFKLYVTVLMKSGAGRYSPQAEYKFFVRLPNGFTMKSVAETAGKTHLENFSADWTGGPDVSGGITINWTMTGNDREKYAYKSWLLATWTSTNVPDTSLDTPLGWTIEVEVDASHSFVADGNEAVMDATLYVKQSNIVKTALSRARSLQIIAAGPALASVTIPDSPFLNGKYVVATGTRLLQVHASLAVAAKTPGMQIRWRQAGGAGAAWNLADPADVPVTSSTELAFTIHYEFTHPVTLEFSCAEEGGSNWGPPFDVVFDVESDLLKLEDFVIKMASGKITLTGTVREPSAQVKFKKLELSIDGGATWQDISGKLTSLKLNLDLTGTTAKDRDFSKGVYVQATDNLNMPTPRQAVLFDAATFVKISWNGTASTSADVDLGERIDYTIDLNAESDTILPTATIDLQLPDSAVEVIRPALNTYLFVSHTSSTPTGSVDAKNWLGTGGATLFYKGPVQSGVLVATALVRANPGLLNANLPSATLTISSEAFFVNKIESVEITKAKVYRPAPYFQIVNPVLKTNRNAVNIRGDFIPPVEAAAALTFNVTVDSSAAHAVTADPLTTNEFELKLDHTIFKEFDNNGNHHVRLAVHRTADTRPAERSSHSEELIFDIDNDAPGFIHPQVAAESNNLVLKGAVHSPGGGNKPVKVFVYWDNSGESRDRIEAKQTGSAPQWTFSNILPFSQFTGWLSPLIEASVDGGHAATQNLLFSTAEGLVKVELSIAFGTTTALSVTHLGTPKVLPGDITFTFTLTALVGFRPKLNLHLTLGEAFSASSITDLKPPASGAGKVERFPDWNGAEKDVTLVAQTEALKQGASFTLIGKTKIADLSDNDVSLLKAQNPSVSRESLESITLSIVESNDPQVLFSVTDAPEGGIFVAQFIPR